MYSKFLTFNLSHTIFATGRLLAIVEEHRLVVLVKSQQDLALEAYHLTMVGHAYKDSFAVRRCPEDFRLPAPTHIQGPSPQISQISPKHWEIMKIHCF